MEVIKVAMDTKNSPLATNVFEETQITRSDDEAMGDKPRDACSGRSGGCLPLSIVSYPSHCSCEAGAMVLHYIYRELVQFPNVYAGL